MGHTHYNELSNDGHTLYTATRSTGTDRRGATVGFSVTNLDNGIVVSWRFIRARPAPCRDDHLAFVIERLLTTIQ